MALIILLYASASFSVFSEASSYAHLRNPSLRATRPAQPDLPLSSTRSSSEPGDASRLVLLDFAAPRLQNPSTCSVSLVDEVHLDGTGKANFDAATGIIVLGSDTVVVIDTSGGAATWGIPTGRLVQSDRLAFLPAPSNISPSSVVANPASNQLFVFGTCDGTTLLLMLVYDDTASQPLGRPYLSEVASTDGDGHVVRAVMSTRNVIAFTTRSGAVYRISPGEDNSMHQSLSRVSGGTYVSTAEAFNPNGDILFLATDANVLLAVDSDGSKSTHDILYSGGDDLCHIAVSPDGRSVYVVSRGTKEIIHVRLSSATKASIATAEEKYSTGRATLSPFVANVMDNVLVVAMESSDELQFFWRDTSTGRLSAGIAANVGALTASAPGKITGLARSGTEGKMVLAMSNGEWSATESLVVLHIECIAAMATRRRTTASVGRIPVDRRLQSYPDCTGVVEWIGDGWCDDTENTSGCSWDGGDCCECECVDGEDWVCGEEADYNCIDPSSACYIYATPAPTVRPTPAPTTATPTTAAPTTAAPTTAAPTTAAPTTAAPTTAAPTTAAPTTAAPTTAAPTTAAPTTAAPTTSTPTAGPPITSAPTTATPSTGAPTTAVPTTVAPTTAAPTPGPTQAPTPPPITPPSPGPTSSQTPTPTEAPSTPGPSNPPTPVPTKAPSRSPTSAPTRAPSPAPSSAPATAPTTPPTPAPTPGPTVSPSPAPSISPTVSPSPAPSPAPTQSPTTIPTPAPTMLSSRPELEEARMAAALIGMDLTFSFGMASSGLWCHGVACFGSVCSVENLLDDGTAATLGSAPSCAWKDEKTVTVVFGSGYSIRQKSMVTLSPTGEYLAGCNGCTQYATGSAPLQGRMPPPEIAAAQFSYTGQQIDIFFEGSASSQEINGSYASVPCGEIFSSNSTATLGVGCTSQFTSPSTLTINLGFEYTIRPASEATCTGGDGTSVVLLDGIARTEIGAFLSSEAGCVAVNPASDPDLPVVEISAPEVVGCCEDLIIEGIASYPSTDVQLNWTVSITDGDQVFDLTDARTVLEKAGASKDFIVTLPSDSLDEGSTYMFGLRVTTALGVWGDAQAEVSKAPDALPALKITGSASRKQWRSFPLTVRAEVSSPRAQNDTATYTWNVASENSATTDFPPLILPNGRNPSVLTLPPYTLGYAGSVYAFRVDLSGGGQSAVSATATVEVVSGAIVAFISGGTARKVGASQTLYLNASASVDDDQMDDGTPLEFAWNCTNDAGADCETPSRSILDITSFTSGALLTIPAGALPIGVEYTFGVRVSRGEQGALDWTEHRFDETACTVSTFGTSLPHVSISPKNILRKYNPSEKMVLYGCASRSSDELCSSSTSSIFELEWRQENGNLDIRDGWAEVFSTAVNDPVFVVRKGLLDPGRSYTFSLSATDSSGLVGYAEFSFETNAPPSGGHLESSFLSVTAGVDELLLQSLGWTDDVDDLPLMHSFGFVHGYHERITIDSESELVNQLSSSGSVSTTLKTNVPPGFERDDFNLTMIVAVSDILGSTAATNLGIDGTPIVVASLSPDEASVLSVAYGLTCYPGEPCGSNMSLAYPSEALRDARVATALLQHAPLALGDDTEAKLALQAGIVGLIVAAYFSLEGSSGSVVAGSQALAEALGLFSDVGPPSESTLNEASRTVADMVDGVAERGLALDDAAAVSFVSVMSEIFDGPSASSTWPTASSATTGTALVGKESRLDLLSEVGNTLASAAESGEELNEIRRGSLAIKPARFQASTSSATIVSVGHNGTQALFSSPEALDEDPGTSRTVSVAVFSSTSSGLDGVIVVDAWDSTGMPEANFTQPIELSMALPGQAAIDVRGGMESPVGYLGCGYWSEDGGVWRTDGMALGALGANPGTSATVMQCATFHLSAFASREDSTTPRWNTADLFMDFRILAKYGAESWAGLLFLGCMAAILLVPASWFAHKDAQHGRHQEYIEALRSTYLAHGKSRREVRPLKKRVTQRVQAARRKLMDDQAREKDGNVFYQISAGSKGEKKMSKVAVESVLFSHSWRHLSGSPTSHFQKTLLTRSQHLVLLLADWMSAIMLQAVFYGKSQFGIREKVEMTVVSALFMLPTGVIFPVLLRAANTPPASKTLERVAIQDNQVQDTNYEILDQLQREQEQRDADFQNALQSARALDPTEHGGFRAPRELSHVNAPSSSATTKAMGHGTKWNFGATGTTTGTTTVVQTTAYKDVMEMQKMLLLVYVPLPILLAMLVSEVLRISREAEAAGGDENAFLHNMVTSLSMASSVLCALSAFAVVSRNARVMVQTTTFQAFVAPGLALCGVLLYGSSVSVAAGAVVGAALALVGSYLVGVQRKYEVILNELVEGDLVAAWSNPTRKMHQAAEMVQRRFRMHHATQRVTRALEFHTWLHDCGRRRRWMRRLASGAVATTILCLTYTNMVFAVKFDRTTSADWLTTCVLALLVEAFIQQPASLLVTGILGDFIEEGADLLLEFVQ